MNKDKERTVRFELDPERPVSLTDEQRWELQQLGDRPDDEIDYGDIPPLDEQNLEKLYRPRNR